MKIAVAADKGGVGKSLLATHLAAAAAYGGQSVTLIDLDHRLASSNWLTRAAAPVQVAPMGEGIQDADLTIYDTVAHPDQAMRDGLVGLDLLLVVASHDLNSQLAAVDLYRDLVDRGGRAWVVLNSVHPSGRAEGRVANLAELGVAVAPTVVRRFACYDHALIDGRLVCDYPYQKADDAWADIQALLAWAQSVAQEILDAV